MIWYPDLSPYTYGPEHVAGYELEYVPAGREVLNVGWLAPGHGFQVGDPPTGFLEALADLYETRQVRIRSWKVCSLCAAEDRKSPCVIQIGEKRLVLGGAEIRVYSEDGAIFAAPDLVLHYVDYHHYLPPAEFIEAAIAHQAVIPPGA